MDITREKAVELVNRAGRVRYWLGYSAYQSPSKKYVIDYIRDAKSDAGLSTTTFPTLNLIVLKCKRFLYREFILMDIEDL